MHMQTNKHNENLIPLNFTDWKITIKVISKCQILGSDKMSHGVFSFLTISINRFNKYLPLLITNKWNQK